MNGVGIFFLVLVFVVILPALAWVGYTRWRAHQQGLPPPPLASYIPFYKSSSSQSSYPIAPRPGGITGWVQDKVSALRNRGGGSADAGGSAAPDAYSYAPPRGRAGFSQLDQDNAAWDDRVGGAHDNDGRIGDYEEQELGIHPAGGLHPGAGGGYRRADGFDDDEPRGRSRSREDLGHYPAPESQRYAGGGYGGGHDAFDPHPGTRTDPFADDAEPSQLRGVSPRPVEMDADSHHLEPGHRKQDSGGSSRRSMFSEGL